MEMNLPVLVGRILHVGLGVFWAGTIFFVVFFLEPSIRSVGPEGGRVMQALQKRGFLVILPMVALLTILSGAYLYGRLLSESGAGWITTPYGGALTIGGVAALLAFGQGFFLMRPATLKVAELSALLAGDQEAGEREATLAEIGAMRSRSRTHARWVALWLGISVLTMAMARYL
jgi:hypothetical protein